MSNESDSRTASGEALKLPSWFVLLVIVGMLGFAWWQNHRASQPIETTGTPNSRTVASLPDEDEPTTAEVEHNRGTDPTNPIAAATPQDSPPPPTVHSVDEKTNPDHPPARPNTSGPLSGLRNRSTAESHPNTPRISSSDRQRPTEKSQGTSYQVENQTIRDLYGKVVYKGTIDLTPTLERIERGESNRHRNDGTSFQNREGRLPRKPAGYYMEYVQPTPGEHGPGPQRIIIGEQGDIWYTSDHYKSFKKIK